ncbi:MAG: hypothetical protein DRI44_06085 [Chlamydiae bacterium]|nr:MAG: hypothetical protein DRI44_06085 [Chlamydiota bacterium]
MTKCDKCGKEVGPLFCGHCRAEIKKIKFNPGKLIPLLYYDTENKRYVVGCTCVECPWNRDGKCITTHEKLPVHLFHEFDGDNIIHQVCG